MQYQPMNNNTKHNGRPAKYPWKLWLSGDKHSIHKGEHFNCEAYAMVLQLRRKASLVGKRVEAKITGDKVIFRALEKSCQN